MATSTLSQVVTEVRTLLGALVSSGPQEWSEPSPAVDGYVALVFCVGLFVVNWGLRLVVIAPIGRVLLTSKKRKAFEPKVVRFAQSAMEALFYGGFTVLGLTIVPKQPWMWPSALWWRDFSSGSHSWMRNDLRCYYLLYGARYFQGGMSVLLEPKRKDFVEMQIHHVVTVAVVAVSYFYGWNRVGAVVMLLLDPADVPLHVAKLLKHVGEAHQRSSPKLASAFFLGADLTFVVFAVVFFITRVAMYPYICWSAHVEAATHFPMGLPEWACVYLLHTLLILQFYWFFLIVKAAAKMILQGHVEDVRSDDEDEEDDKDD